VRVSRSYQCQNCRGKGKGKTPTGKKLAAKKSFGWELSKAKGFGGITPLFLLREFVNVNVLEILPSPD